MAGCCSGCEPGTPSRRTLPSKFSGATPAGTFMSTSAKEHGRRSGINGSREQPSVDEIDDGTQGHDWSTAMSSNVTQKLIRSNLVQGDMKPGEEIGIRIDQTLTQDATGTLVMLELESMGLDRVKTEISVQYVDHNFVQADHKNPDDHLFLRSACQRFGVWYSRPGNGVSHPCHQENFGKQGVYPQD